MQDEGETLRMKKGGGRSFFAPAATQETNAVTALVGADAVPPQGVAGREQNVARAPPAASPYIIRQYSAPGSSRAPPGAMRGTGLASLHAGTQRSLSGCRPLSARHVGRGASMCTSLPVSTAR